MVEPESIEFRDYTETKKQKWLLYLSIIALVVGIGLTIAGSIMLGIGISKNNKKCPTTDCSSISAIPIYVSAQSSLTYSYSSQHYAEASETIKIQVLNALGFGTSSSFLASFDASTKTQPIVTILGLSKADDQTFTAFVAGLSFTSNNAMTTAEVTDKIQISQDLALYQVEDGKGSSAMKQQVCTVVGDFGNKNTPSTTSSPITVATVTSESPCVCPTQPVISPGCSTENPITVVPSSPAPVSTEGPSTAVPNTPASVSTEGPSTAVPNTPASVATEGPSTAVPNTPASVATEGPSTAVPNTPASVATEGPSTAVPNTLASSSTEAVTETTIYSKCPDCYPDLANIMVVIDSSSQMSPDIYESQKKAVEKLLSSWNHSERLSFGSHAETFVESVEYWSNNSVSDIVNTMSGVVQSEQKSNLTASLQVLASITPIPDFGQQYIILFVGVMDPTDITYAYNIASILQESSTVIVVGTNINNYQILAPLASDNHLIIWMDTSNSDSVISQIMELLPHHNSPVTPTFTTLPM